MSVQELVEILSGLDPDEEIGIGDLKDIFRDHAAGSYL